MPTTPRIAALDVVRGFAVLGILPVNAAFFAYPLWAALNPGLPPHPITDATAWTWALTHTGFELKMITLFSMLFGVSLFLVGGDGGDDDRSQTLRARLFWLGVFGALHGALIWYGDILLTYAVCGAVVMGLRGMGARALTALGVGLLGVAIALEALLGAGMAVAAQMGAGPDPSNALWTPSDEELNRIIAAMRAGVLPALGENLREWSEFLISALYFAPRTIGLMLLGLGLFKFGFFHGRWPAWAYGAVLAVGAVSLALTGWRTAAALGDDGAYSIEDAFGLEGLWHFMLSLPMAMGYAAGLILVVRFSASERFPTKWTPVGRMKSRAKKDHEPRSDSIGSFWALGFVTGPLAACGRMAFTNYLSQSLLMTTLFWGGRGFGLFGEIDRVGLWGVVVAIWALQLAWSTLWLRAFAVGPLEWLWRSLTVGKFVALRNPT
jgi:uncharacterized protein